MLRQQCAGIFSLCAAEDAPLFDALLLGDKSLLTEETKTKFQLAGIIHLLAISGLHISLVGVSISRLLGFLGLGFYIRNSLCLLLVLSFGMLTGGSVSTLRAVSSYLLSVGAKGAGRSTDLPTTLSVTALLILLESPAYLYSASFLLSFGAVLSLAFYVPPVLRSLKPLLPKKDKLLSGLLSSALISLGTMPIVLYSYGEVSLVGCLLNLIVLPTAGLVLGCGAIALLLSLLPGGILLSRLAIYPARALLWLYDLLCEGALRLPFCTLVGGRCSLPSALAYYALLGLGVAVLKGKIMLKISAGLRRAGKSKGRKEESKNRRLKSHALSFTLLCCLAVFLLTFHPRRSLSITCLDIGQGDAIVIQTPEGKNFLVDGGSTSRNKIGTYVLLPYLKSQGISHLDGIFLSHTDEDHYNGMKELLEARRAHLSSLSIGALYLPSWESPPPVWEELSMLAEEAGATVTALKRGDRLLSGKVSFTVLAPFPGATGEDPNEDGMVLRIAYRSFTGLLVGDIGFETEEKLLSNNGNNNTDNDTTTLWLSPVTYLKVGHHGSAGSSGEAFVHALSPRVGVISCARVNRYGHPSPEAVERLEKAGCTLEYTMEGGAITLLTNGKDYFVECFVGE